MTHTQTLIIGQGLCGTWLSWWLSQQNHDFLLVDEGNTSSSSRIASGVINPVTGRVLAPTWMVETLIPFALQAYTAIGKELSIPCIQSTRILHSFPTIQMKQAFEKKLPDLPEYLEAPSDTAYWEQFMSIPYGLGSIHPALLIDLSRLLSGWQNQLVQTNRFIRDRFRIADFEFNGNQVRYKDILANRIVFCDGIQGMELPWFNRLPFSPNKGEALLLEIDGLPPGYIYKKGISLVPYPNVGETSSQSYFWAGSTYENNFQTEQPTDLFRKRTEVMVSNWIKLPFKTLHHWAGVRPATLERRPFVGFHPYFPTIGILNGMGTKGCSLAPYFGKQMADHITAGSAIQADSEIARFSSLLRP